MPSPTGHRASRPPTDWSAAWRVSPTTSSAVGKGARMNVEAKLEKLGLEIPNLEDLYRTNSSGAHYISHYPVQNLLYLSGTTPRKGGQPYLPGVVGKDLT